MRRPTSPLAGELTVVRPATEADADLLTGWHADPAVAEFWDGEPVVWTHMWGGRWGVWKNGEFITLSSNINTGGG